MKKIVWVYLMVVCSVSISGMQDTTTAELYKQCQQWFQDCHIRTIASHVVELQKRKGSFVSNPVAVEVRSTTAQAKFDVAEQNVTIHKIEFPGVPKQEPVATIPFAQVTLIKAFIESQDKT